MEGGPSAVTIDAIVARSGVAKSTIYRHWESRDEVLVDVIESCAPTLAAPDPALGFEHAVRAVVDQAYAALNDPEWARVIPALLLLKAHQTDIADLEERIGGHQDQTLDAIVALGVAEGRLPAGADIEEIAAQLIGPLVFAHLTGRPRVTKAYAGASPTASCAPTHAQVVAVGQPACAGDGAGDLAADALDARRAFDAERLGEGAHPQLLDRPRHVAQVVGHSVEAGGGSRVLALDRQHLLHPSSVAGDVTGEMVEAVLDAAHVAVHVGQAAGAAAAHEARRDQPRHDGPRRRGPSVRGRRR